MAILAFNPKIELSDLEIIEMICRSNASRKEAIEVIYQWHDLKNQVEKFVTQHGGSSTESLGIFHEGIIILDRNIRHGKYTPEANLQGYLYSICRYIWKNEWRKKQKKSNWSFKADEIDDDTPEIQLFDQERKSLLKKVLGMLDESCRKILTLWKLSYTMDEIAQNLGLSSGQLAKKYKYRCLKKLMLTLDQKPNLLEALK